MKSGSQNSGFTLIEMVVVVAIIAILISMVFGVAKRVEEQGKIRLCKDTLALIDNALEQFRDFGYEYKSNDYDGLVFPLDCNNFSQFDLRTTIESALNLAPLSVSINIVDPCQQDNSSSEALYFFLNQVPDCRATLEKIDKSLVTNNVKGTTTTKTITFTSSSQTLPFMRIIDPWKTPLRYDYYPEYADYLIKYPTGTWTQYLDYRNSAKLTFPIVTTLGPDKKFGTKDDISNRQ